MPNNNDSMSGLFSILTGRYKNNTLSNIGFIEEKEYEKGFKEHYNKYLRPEIEKFEERRLRALDKSSNAAKKALPLAIITIPILVFLAQLFLKEKQLLI